MDRHKSIALLAMMVVVLACGTTQALPTASPTVITHVVITSSPTVTMVPTMTTTPAPGIVVVVGKVGGASAVGRVVPMCRYERCAK